MVDVAQTSLPPPPGQTRWRRLREAYAAGPVNIAITLAVVMLASYVAVSLYRWGVADAVFGGDAIEECRGASGACWSIIALRWRLILFGLYPFEEQWRAAVGIAIVIMTIALACMPAFWTAVRMVGVWLTGFTSFFLIVGGGAFGLEHVPPNGWGGLTLTLFIYLTVIAFGLPLAIVIALITRDTQGPIRNTVVLCVDAIRSLPLITVLFAAVVILPFLMSDGMLGDKVYRVVIGFAIFFACYQSQNVLAGLQSVPEGQSEAGRALGLSYWRITSLVVMPQAFKASMPATINQFVVTFKETSLVAIVGLFDLMTSGRAAFNTGELQPYYKEVYIFVAIIYFLAAFSMSRYGAYLERRMAVGTDRSG